jgi:hypothetical protein
VITGKSKKYGKLEFLFYNYNKKMENNNKNGNFRIEIK